VWNEGAVRYFDVFTGFKHIAEILKKLEGKETFIGGGEESYGYLVGDFVRDKDAVVSCAMFAEITAWAKQLNKTVFDVLIDIYHEHALYKERLLSIIREGKSGAEEIQKMMDEYRNKPYTMINNSKVIKIRDYLFFSSVTFYTSLLLHQ